MIDMSDDKYLDVLQNIEFTIVEVYNVDRSLLDIDAKEAIDALVRYYRAVEDDRRAARSEPQRTRGAGLRFRSEGVRVAAREGAAAPAAVR